MSLLWVRGKNAVIDAKLDSLKTTTQEVDALALTIGSIHVGSRQNCLTKNSTIQQRALLGLAVCLLCQVAWLLDRLTMANVRMSEYNKGRVYPKKLQNHD